MYIDIYNKGKLVKRTSEIIGGINWSNELMYVPQCSLTFPIEYRKYIDGHGEIKVYVNGKCFWGIVTSIDANTDNGTMQVTLDHKISEWRYRQLAINNAILNGKLNFVYKSNADKVVYSISDDKNYSKYFSLVASKVQIKQNAYDISEEKLIELGQAVCYQTKNVALTIPVRVKKHDIKQELGTYHITFIASGVNQDGVVETAEAEVEATVSVKGGDVANKRVDEGLYTLQEQLSDIYHDNNFAYPDWEIDFQDDSPNYTIDYVYSKQNKLDALTHTMEHTQDLWWRIGFKDEKKIEIGKFGKKTPYMFSQNATGEHNIRIIDEPTIKYDFDNVVNLATVYSDKGDSGMSSLTLREVYNHTDSAGVIDKMYRLDNPECKFPVVILRDNIISDVNNERYYGTIQEYTDLLPKIAPNNIYEYAIIDLDSVAMEGGKILEECFAFNDLGAFNIDGEKIDDTYRAKASFVAYNSAIRKLKQTRRTFVLSFNMEELPIDINVGDKVRLVYSLDKLCIDKCSNRMKKLMVQDRDWYITSIDYQIDANGVETDKVTLMRELKLERDIKENVD